MKKIIRRVVTLVIIAGVLGGVYWLGSIYLWPPPDTSQIKVVGMVEAPEVNLTSRIAGRIVDFPLLEGDNVRQRDVVCRIEDIDLKNQTEKSQADMLHARAAMENAQRTLARQARLYAATVISQKDRDDAQTAYDQAIADLASAKANVDYYRDQMRDTTIESPVDGVIVSKNLQVGEWVTPGTPVVTIDDLSTIWARVDVQETDLSSIYVGKPAQITIPGNPPINFTGRVTAIGQEGNFATERDVRRGRQDIRTFYVKVQALQGGGELKPGMTAEVAFERRQDGNRISRDTDKGTYQALR